MLSIKLNTGGLWRGCTCRYEVSEIVSGNDEVIMDLCQWNTLFYWAVLSIYKSVFVDMYVHYIQSLMVLVVVY